jgi:hypothetical protein
MNRGRYDEQISEPVSVLAGVTILASIGPMHTASACGDSEAPSCGSSGTPEEARWMLNRAVREVKADQSGENGSRTMDLYVFCIGPDNKIDAHPNPSLMGQMLATSETRRASRLAPRCWTARTKDRSPRSGTCSPNWTRQCRSRRRRL